MRLHTLRKSSKALGFSFECFVLKPLKNPLQFFHFGKCLFEVLKLTGQHAHDLFVEGVAIRIQFRLDFAVLSVSKISSFKNVVRVQLGKMYIDIIYFSLDQLQKFRRFHLSPAIAAAATFAMRKAPDADGCKLSSVSSGNEYPACVGDSTAA